MWFNDLVVSDILFYSVIVAFSTCMLLFSVFCLFYLYWFNEITIPFPMVDVQEYFVFCICVMIFLIAFFTYGVSFKTHKFTINSQGENVRYSNE